MNIFKNIALLCLVSVLAMGGFTAANASDDIRIVKINDNRTTRWMCNLFV